MDSSNNGRRSATLDSEEERLLRRLKSDFSCGICLSILKDAIATPCGHLFCSGCLRRWEQSVFPEIKCPKCRKSFKMEDTIRTYNSLSGQNPKHTALASKRAAGQEPSFRCRRFGNILLYDTDFSDSFSLRSVILLIFSFSVLFATILYLLRS